MKIHLQLEMVLTRGFRLAKPADEVLVSVYNRDKQPSADRRGRNDRKEFSS